MQTLEALRRRLQTADDLRAVVGTMKTLAAVSIRQYETALRALEHYEQTVELGFRILLAGRPFPTEIAEPESDHVAAVVFGSDQGLCGGFNDEMAGFCNERLTEWSKTGSARLLVVGARLADRLMDVGVAADGVLGLPGTVGGITQLVQEILPRLERWRAEGSASRIVVLHHRRTLGASYGPRERCLLPLPADRLQAWSRQRWESRSLPMYTLPRPRLFSVLVRQYLFVSIFAACAESRAAENSARIAAMQAAERSIEERLDELRLAFHQQRQTAITAEILEVVGGFEALAASRKHH